MTITLRTPDTTDLARLRTVLCDWQHDDLPLQLHPGDLGWSALRGDEAAARAIRVWTQGDDVAAIALLDGSQLLRLAFDPERVQDAGLAARIAADVDDPAASVLEAGEAVVEARGATALGSELQARGWQPDEPWTPLHRDLRAPIDVEGPRIRAVEPAETEDWVRVHWSAFRGGAVPPERLATFVDGWMAVARSPLFGEARILALDDGDGATVAVAAVWSAGPGRPGLVEPMGVHEAHRGRGYGAQVTCAAAAALRDLGSSSAIVCAESSNRAAIATYVAAGFEPRAEVADWARSA